LEFRFQKYTTELDKQIEKLKAQEDNEFMEIHNSCQLLENTFVYEHKVNKAGNFREIVKEQMEEMKKNAEVTEKIKEKKLKRWTKNYKTQKIILKKLDEKSRRNNIIMYIIPESVSDSIGERKVLDKRFVLSLLTKTEIWIDEGDIIGAFRLGKWNSDENPQAVPRPVLVQFHNIIAKKLDNGEFVFTETPGKQI